MGVFEVTQDDIDSQKLVKPGWHPFTITDVEDVPSDKDGSTNTVVSLKGADEASQGVELRGYFNEKPEAQRFAVGFLRAANGGVIQPGVKYNIDRSLIGNVVDCLIANVPYMGKMGNKLVDYRAPKPAA